MATISFTKLLVIAAIIVLLFGTNKLRTLGSDLGAAIKGFKKALNEDDHNDIKSENEQKQLTNAGNDKNTTETQTNLNKRD